MKNLFKPRIAVHQLIHLKSFKAILTLHIILEQSSNEYYKIYKVFNSNNQFIV